MQLHKRCRLSHYQSWRWSSLRCPPRAGRNRHRLEQPSWSWVLLGQEGFGERGRGQSSWMWGRDIVSSRCFIAINWTPEGEVRICTQCCSRLNKLMCRTILTDGIMSSCKFRSNFSIDPDHLMPSQRRQSYGTRCVWKMKWNSKENTSVKHAEFHSAKFSPKTLRRIGLFHRFSAKPLAMAPVPCSRTSYLIYIPA